MERKEIDREKGIYASIEKGIGKGSGTKEEGKGIEERQGKGEGGTRKGRGRG